MFRFSSLITIVILLLNCQPPDDLEIEHPPAEAIIIGSWELVGFEETVRYVFTKTKRYTLYSTDGYFPTLEEFLTENPDTPGNDWSWDGDVVVVDLNFGNFSRLIPRFKCNNYVIDWLNEEGEVHSTIFRIGYNFADCTN